MLSWSKRFLCRSLCLPAKNFRRLNSTSAQRRPNSLRCHLVLEELEPRLAPATTFDVQSVVPTTGSVAGTQSVTITTTSSSTPFSGQQLTVQFTQGGVSKVATSGNFYVDGHDLTFPTPVYAVQGSYTLKLTDAGLPGPQTTSGANLYTYSPIKIQSLSPNSGYVSGNQVVTITAPDAADGFGSSSSIVGHLSVNFALGSTNNYGSNITWVSSTQIQVTTPAVATTGSYTVTVYVNGTPDSVPVQPGNNTFTYTAAPSFTQGKVYITNSIGTQLPAGSIYLLLEGNGKYYTINSDGSLTVGSGTTPLSTLPTSGSQYYFNLPVPFSAGRLYFTTDKSLTIQPPAVLPNNYYDYSEVTLQSGSLTADTSQVDQFGMPLTIQVTPNDPANPTGAGVNTGITRGNVFTQYQADMTGPFQAYQDDLANSPYQILAPQYVINAQFSNVFQQPANTSTYNNTIQLAPVAGGTMGNWEATLTLTGTASYNFNQFSNANGTVYLSGPFIPAGTTILKVNNANQITVLNTSSSDTNPFPANPTNITPTKNGAGVNFITAPAKGFSGLASWFGPNVSSANPNSSNAIDAFFNYYETHPLYLEDNGSGSFVLYTGKVTTITNTDIDGGTSTYLVLQFTAATGDSNTYNIYYPYFTTNSPVGKTYTNPSTGKQVAVPPPPAYFTLGNTYQSLSNYLSPSQMVFGASGVFADQSAQWMVMPPATSPQSKVQADLERDVAASLIRGYGSPVASANAPGLLTTSDPLSGPLPTFKFNAGSQTQGTWTLTSSAGDQAVGAEIKTLLAQNPGLPLYADSLQSLNYPFQINSISTTAGGLYQLSVTSINGAVPQPAPDNLLVFYLYQQGTTYDAYSAFFQSRGAFTNGYNGQPINLGGRAYGDAYSDFMGFSSTITSIPNPQGPQNQMATLAITLDSWGTSVPAPTNLTANPGNAQVVLNWTASAGATGYNIYRGTTSGGESGSPLNSSPITTNTYTDSSVSNGVTYFYYVKAVGISGTSPASNEASATPSASLPPPAPTNLTASPGNAQVILNWTASAGATSYNVYRGTTSRGESPTPIATGVTSNSYTDSSASNGVTYYYYVKAVGTSGTSVASNEASATPSSSTPPPAPTNLTATAGNLQVVLNWTASTGATSYNIYRGTSSGGESPTPIVTGVTATTYTNTGLNQDVTYYYYVRAVNSAGQSPDSNEASATPTGAIPAPPTNLAAEPGNNQVILSWIASAGATGYNIYRGTASGGEQFPPLNSSPVPGTTFTDSTGVNGTTYYYVITAVNGSGESGASNEASATPTASIPSPPTNLAALPGTGVVFLTWNASAGATSYNVYRGTTSGGEQPPPVAEGVVGTSFSDASVTNGTTYYYVVTAVNSSGESDYSNEAFATPSDTAIPPAPANLASVASNASVFLSWDPSPGATGYNLYRGTGSGGEQNPPLNGNIPITGTTYTDNAVINGTTYYYIVTAVNQAGESPDSNETSATPSTSLPPAAPTNLSASPGNNQVFLSWTASAGAASYDVYRGTISGGEQYPPLDTGISGTSYTDNSVTNGTTYYYVVTAVSSVGGESLYSNEASTKPLPPANIAATAGGGQSVLVNTAFGTALEATVTNQNGQPVPGVTVVFTASSGNVPAGTFPNGSNVISVVTNSSGVATAPAFTANLLAGTYTISASVIDVGTPAKFTLTNLSPLGSGPNAIYVENIYGLLLSRVADPGAEYWVDLLNTGPITGITPSTVVQAIEQTPEYHTDLVKALYQHYLGRAGSPAEWAGWAAMLDNGTPLEVVTAYILSAGPAYEYYNSHGGGTPLGFVQALYKNVLGRLGSTAEWDGWVGVYYYYLSQGQGQGQALYQVAIGLLTSPEYDTDLVKGGTWTPYNPLTNWGGYYPEFLLRPGSSAEWSGWVQALQDFWAGKPGGMTDQQVLAAIFGSTEGYSKWS